ncbi:acid protease, partial [Suillus decipiens]
LAFSVTGSPVEVRNSPITLPITRRLAFPNVTDLLRHDEARLATFGEYGTHGRRDVDTSPHPIVPLSHTDLRNSFSGYTVKVIIGDPPAIYDLILDGSSAITWVGASAPYVSFSGVNTREPVAVDYLYGSFRGMTYSNIMYFGVRQLLVPRMQIGVASTAWNIAADGVIGIGPTLSGLDTLQNSLDQTIPTITDRLFSLGSITRPAVGIFFQPIVVNTVNHGEITFGGSHPQMHDQTIKYTDITTTVPSSRYWGIDLRVTYGKKNILDYTAGIVDCGCTFIYLATDAYDRYKAATGGIVNEANGLLQISLAEYDALSDLNFHIGEQIYPLIPNAQIWPRSLNEKIEGGANDIFLI